MGESRSTPKHLFKLYVTGDTPRSRRAIANLRRLCAEFGGCEVNIIDVLEQPHRAEQDRVLVTPTLIRQLPPPVRRILGDLSDAEKVLAELDLSREKASSDADQEGVP